MKKEVICTKDAQFVQEGENEEFQLRYAVNAIQLTEESQRVYEIAVEKWRGGCLLEKEETGGITFDLKKAVQFLDTLCRNRITPMCLLEVTDDAFYGII